VACQKESPLAQAYKNNKRSSLGCTSDDMIKLVKLNFIVHSDGIRHDRGYCECVLCFCINCLEITNNKEAIINILLYSSSFNEHPVWEFWNVEE
jgi:hypothetical protein